MMELWPFTNFHDLNLDWIIKTIRVYTKKVDDLYNFGLYDFVERVLAAHPEWTTTVMDGAITSAKINKEYKEFPYYDNVTYEEHRTDHTDYYLVDVPVLDSDGEVIGLYLEENPSMNPLEVAAYKGTNVTINGGCSITYNGEPYPIMICEGNVTNNNSWLGMGNPYPLYIGMREDRTIIEYDCDSSVSSAQMLADGCTNVWNCYFKLVENSQVVDMGTDSDGVHWGSYYPTNQTINPLMLMGVKSGGELLFLACDGRTETNTGLSYQKAGEIMIAQGCHTVYNLDGGGSSCMCYRGSKMNRNIDGGGRTVRQIDYTINVRKPIGTDNTRYAYGQTGLIRQHTIEQLMRGINYLWNLNPLTSGNDGLFEGGEDLDDYNHYGKYISQTGEISATLSNTPFTSQGFTMYVSSQGTAGYVLQTLVANDGKSIWYRLLGISDWIRVRNFTNLFKCYTFNQSIVASGTYERATLTFSASSSSALGNQIVSYSSNEFTVERAGTGVLKVDAGCVYITGSGAAGNKFLRLVRDRNGTKTNYTISTYCAASSRNSISLNTMTTVTAGDIIYLEVNGYAGDTVQNGYLNIEYTDYTDTGTVY